ncbi:Uncharacterised protein [Mycobacteroides abscessus subsp. massiliense]|uniref:hypothetical protein n=1 Tax=Mycobacteroides abscessus TaxID=36809 RepID=UPI0002D4E806|nr:hypothetical protein [Mycobacteroides abscessus]ANN99422.1 hypothetical protein BAB74_12335 [Mycobacteroides abscessus]MBN7384533.1 hypothetical protein [Mycobacteroides abscessus subsp. abscessus]MBN7415299.1 hypothetical protein [Mycobacteroides abscessus subsp. abscessus]SKH36143.1 Uncharacterised protein [Mycobacteroides abscessus subsp. bolletii]SKU91258.1 Uncharacterised protein [Mycobacteroides abscessus subsp. bolletii]
MTITPLPVRTRLFHGENLDSYTRRHAARNFCKPSDVDNALRERGYINSKSRRDPDRLQAWRDLGGLQDAAFISPDHVLDQEVSERPLCLRCTRGEAARGKLTGVGLVCARHRQWLGYPQVDLHGYFPAIAAERHFRRHLAARNVLHDSLPMLIGRECASPAIIGSREIDRRRNEFDIEAMDALTYPEQVTIARLLCSPGFLYAATDPDADAVLRSSFVAKEVEKIIPARDDAESWRATNRVWTAITHLTGRRRDARIYGVPMRDTYYNILRFIDAP